MVQFLVRLHQALSKTDETSVCLRCESQVVSKRLVTGSISAPESKHFVDSVRPVLRGLLKPISYGRFFLMIDTT